jgi:hypothetical protein
VGVLSLYLVLLFSSPGSGIGRSVAWAAGKEAGSSQSDQRAVADMSFGIKGGLSFAQHYGTEERHPEYKVSSDWRESFAIGAFLYFPVTRRFGLQQELLYIRKGSHQDIGVEILDIPTVLDVTYDADYLEIPVLLRFAWLQSNDLTLRSFSGFALSLKVSDAYRLRGEVDDGSQVVPMRADADMREVDLFDYAFTYGMELGFRLWGREVGLEHRFTIGWNTLAMPTYAYVPFGDEQILIENEPVPLRNQNHLVLLCLRL